MKSEFKEMGQKMEQECERLVFALVNFSEKIKEECLEDNGEASSVAAREDISIYDPIAEVEYVNDKVFKEE